MNGASGHAEPLPDQSVALRTTRARQLVLAGFLVSLLWVVRPIEMPLALLAPMLLVAATIASDAPLRRVDPLYLMLAMSALLLVAGHWVAGNLDGADAAWQFLRICYPLFGACAATIVSASLDAQDKRRLVTAALDGGTTIMLAEALLRTAIHPGLAWQSFLGSTEALYDFKSLSLLYIDANGCAFMALYMMGFLLVEWTSCPPATAGEHRLLVRRVAVLVAIIALSFSRQAWYGCAATLLMAFMYRWLPAGGRWRRVLSSPSLLCVGALLMGLYIVVAADTLVEAVERDSVQAGSVGSKFDIALYTAAFGAQASPAQWLFGLGPQKVIEENIISYTGHSLIGIFPEFGLAIALMLAPWFRRRAGLIIFLPLLAGATVSFYPYAYILPVLLLHPLLPTGGTARQHLRRRHAG